MFRCSIPEIPCFYLVDTPGFDDSKRSDTDILGEVANWLSVAYRNKVKLSGIVYLHRISDVRVGGSGVKNLRMFRKLCGETGPKAMTCVALVTTFWDQIEKNVGEEREKQLTTSTTFWSHIISKGGKVFRNDIRLEKGAVYAAKNSILCLAGRREKMVLEIQKDMVDRGKTLQETGAGRIVQEELNKLKAEHKRELERIRSEWKEALEDQDEEWQKEIQAYKAEIKQKMREDKTQRERLQQSEAALRQKIDEEMNAEREKYNKEMQETRRKIKEYELSIKTTHQQDQKVFRLLYEEIEREKKLAEKYRASARGMYCMVM